MKKRFFRIALLSTFLIISLMLSCLAASQYQLRYSDYVGTPVDYYKQNCYYYALNQKAASASAIGDPGCFAGIPYNNGNTFLQNVLADLQALGYTAQVTTNYNVELSSNQFILAYYFGLWRSAATHGTFVEEPGYHFWVRRDNYMAKTNWYHKYGTQSCIMLFNYVPIESNKAFVCDEYYNSILDIYRPPVCFPAAVFPVSGSQGDGTWGYILVTDSRGSGTMTVADEQVYSTNSTDLDIPTDHSIGTILDNLRREGKIA